MVDFSRTIDDKQCIFQYLQFVKNGCVHEGTADSKSTSFLLHSLWSSCDDQSASILPITDLIFLLIQNIIEPKPDNIKDLLQAFPEFNFLLITEPPEHVRDDSVRAQVFDGDNEGNPNFSL